MKNKITIREAACKRTPLSGTDAQALEGALQLTERERNLLHERVKELESLLSELLKDYSDDYMKSKIETMLAKHE